MSRKKSPTTLYEWTERAYEMSDNETWIDLLEKAPADHRLASARGLYALGASLVTIERRKIFEALKRKHPEKILHTPTDDFQIPHAVDDRFAKALRTNEWFDYCMTVATVADRDRRRDELMQIYEDFLIASNVRDPVDFMDFSAAELIAETRVLALEAMNRITQPFALGAGINPVARYTAENVVSEHPRSDSLLQQTRATSELYASSHIQILKAV